ncbi:hypothetical protein LSAT2_017001 [Lamellibrachia satsuma]|nr:hypothetical protein LSAT2_017001 [Lamellibrachia satsuma]
MFTRRCPRRFFSRGSAVDASRHLFRGNTAEVTSPSLDRISDDHDRCVNGDPDRRWSTGLVARVIVTTRSTNSRDQCLVAVESPSLFVCRAKQRPSVKADSFRLTAHRATEDDREASERLVEALSTFNKTSALRCLYSRCHGDASHAATIKRSVSLKESLRGSQAGSDYRRWLASM